MRALPVALMLLALEVGGMNEPGTPWREVCYRGHTTFTVVRDPLGACVHAEANDSNSARVRPLGPGIPGRLSWRWRVLRHPRGADTSRRDTDDRPAGIFVLVKRSVLPWRTRGIVYQWSESAEMGRWQPSPYASGIRVLTLRRDPASEQWHHESRDLRADLVDALGVLPEHLDAIGLLCDSDDTGDIAIAEFGDLSIEASMDDSPH